MLSEVMQHSESAWALSEHVVEMRWPCEGASYLVALTTLPSADALEG